LAGVTQPLIGREHLLDERRHRDDVRVVAAGKGF